ncbi:MAG: hypothetical protein HYZ74_00660 [Elusimicrobia bacterium]|nr:hypothetical protein [Elusimicrobiota bacterium]
MSRGLLIASAAIALLWAVPWARLNHDFHERRDERRSMASLLGEANRLALTFPQVVVSHPAYAGKPVYWVVAPSSAASYAEGRPSWPVLWTNPDRFTAEMPGSSFHNRVLARVAAVKDDTVYLEYVGMP